MESMRLLQRRTLQQLFQMRPGQPSSRLLQRTSQQPFRTRSSQFSTFSRICHAPRPSSSPFSRAARRTFQRTARRFESTESSAPTQNLSLSGRLKKLSREYGWSALGVYLLLTALDFPFCFLAVRLIGTDKIGHWEHIIVSWIKETVTWPMAGHEDAKEHVDDATEAAESLVMQAPLENVKKGEKRLLEEEQSLGSTSPQEAEGEKRILEEDETYVDHGYHEAEEAASKSNASLWTQLVLAYAIHKSFIFIRVPLTAAVTPKVVKTLRGWGWNIGKMPKRKGVADSRSKSGVNTKGSGVKPDD